MDHDQLWTTEATSKQKKIVKLFLQFKHMLLFVNEHLTVDCRNEIDRLTDSQFQKDLNRYLAQHLDLIGSIDVDEDRNPFCEFIRQNEIRFGTNSSYCRLQEGEEDLSEQQSSTIASKPIESISRSKAKTKRRSKRIISNSSSSVKDDDAENDNQDPSYNLVPSLYSETTYSSDDEQQVNLPRSEHESADSEESRSDMFGIPISFMCSFSNCKFQHMSRERVKAHELRKHGDKNIECQVSECDEKFHSQADLSAHLTSAHKIFQCLKCESNFTTEFRLNMHNKREHVHDYMTCSFCDRTFKNRIMMKKHIRFVHVEGEYACPTDDCTFVAKFRKELVYHKSTTHLRKMCPHCNRTMPSTYFKRHLKLHTQIRDYACSWPDCGKRFSESKTLKDHVRIHLNFKRYKCKWPNCVYASEQQSNLITHIRVRHLKVPQTKKKQLEMNISSESLPNPFDFVEVCSEDICIKKL